MGIFDLSNLIYTHKLSAKSMSDRYRTTDLDENYREEEYSPHHTENYTERSYAVSQARKRRKPENDRYSDYSEKIEKPPLNENNDYEINVGNTEPNRDIFVRPRRKPTF